MSSPPLQLEERRRLGGRSEIAVASDEEDTFEMGENEIVEAEVEVDPEGEEEFIHYWEPQGRVSSCFDNDVNTEEEADPEMPSTPPEAEKEFTDDDGTTYKWDRYLRAWMPQGRVSSRFDNDVNTSEIEVVVDPVGSTETAADASPPSETRSPAAAQLSEVRTYVHPFEQSTATRAIKSLVYVGLPTMLTSFSGVAAVLGGRTPTPTVFAAACGSIFALVILGFLDLYFLREEHWGPDPNPITLLHVVMTMIGFIVNSLLPPVVYYYSFRLSDNKRLKFAVVSTVSLFCILLQSIARATVRNRLARAAVQNRWRPYLSTIGIYMACAFVLPAAAFGISRFVLYVTTQAQQQHF